jgi:hypothetical protein
MTGNNGGVGAGTIGALWRFPVKSMQGERLQQLECTQAGVIGDRAYALIDAQTGKVVSAKSVRLFPDLLRCTAEFVAAPTRGGDMPPVRITLPTGQSIGSDESDVDRVLSEHFHRPVKLARTAPEDVTIDQYHPRRRRRGPRRESRHHRGAEAGLSVVCVVRRAVAGSIRIFPGRVPGVGHDHVNVGKAHRIGPVQSDG